RDLYIRDADGEPVAVDLMTWAMWFEAGQKERIVLRERVARDAEVSTVFLSLDHNWAFQGPPVLWETLVFGGVFEGLMNRYTSALGGAHRHHRGLGRVRRIDEPLYESARCAHRARRGRGAGRDLSEAAPAHEVGALEVAVGV